MIFWDGRGGWEFLPESEMHYGKTVTY